jgi:ABC-type uncharacterized transport system auxiliary subunit
MKLSGLLKKCGRGSATGARATAIVLALAIAGIYGCAAVPPSKYYQLSAPSEVGLAASADPLPVTLLVGPVKGSHLYREDPLVYATENQEMGTYQLHRWAEPPIEMMRELLWRSLRASRRYSAVYLLTSNSHGDYLLEGNLYDFKEISGSKPAARINLALELREMKTGAVVWTHDYAHDEPVSGKDVPAFVAALDKNAQRGVSEVAVSLNEYFAQHPRK